MAANDTQVGGSHYKDMGDFQPWDVVGHWLTPEEYRGYHKAVAIAYLARERAKNGDQDIKKAIHHLQKLLEVIETTKQAEVMEVKPAASESGGGWVTWTGGDCRVDPGGLMEIRFGDCPVNPSDLIDVKFASGQEIHNVRACHIDWQHEEQSANNVIAYRLR